MTKFIDNTKKKATINTTVFTHVVNHNYNLEKPLHQPEDFDNVEYIGYNGNNHLFTAWDNDVDTKGFYLGTKGDEFNN